VTTEGPDREIRRWLEGHVNLETGSVGLPGGGGRGGPTLERIAELAALLGSPHTAYPVVHVTGTNGKTSTARMAAALLAARGLSVGLVTSPHLARVNERLSWNGDPVADGVLDGLLDSIRRVEPLMTAPPSYFEILTAAGFAWFADVAADVVVAEVGLGGAWDATNIVDATVAVVTNVGIDHVEYLGPDRVSIAKEKAGIVKEGCTLVLGETDPELAPIFLGGPRPDRVVRREVDFGVHENVVAHGGRLVDLFTSGKEYEEVFLPLHGAHQGDNAACALAAAEAFFGGIPIEEELLVSAYASVEMPGRLEVVGRHPLVMLDGAHNPAGARALQVALTEEFPIDARTFVVGLLREKEPGEMLAALGVSRGDRVVACRPPSPRALDPAAVDQAARALGVTDASVVDSVEEAVARALAVTPEDGQVVVTGSLYTVGAARVALTS
jgi:dihydrofolate synthase/folylpolyglutamate synthase